jgi:hypothetical protein
MSEKKIKFNILTRPKRQIHYQKLSANKELLDQIGTLSDESDDEEFIPTSKSGQKNLNTSKENNTESDSCGQNSLDSSREDIDSDDTEDNSETDISSDFSENESNNKVIMDKIEKSLSKTIKINQNENDSKSLSISESKNTKSIDKKVKTKLNKSKKSKIQAKIFEFDQETQKIINSFKKSKISIKKNFKCNEEKRSKTKRSIRSNIEQKNTKENASQLNSSNDKQVNQGPFVWTIRQQVNIDKNKTIELPIHVVKQQHSAINNDENEFLNSDPMELTQKYKRLLPKEKHFPVLKPEMDLEDKSEWVCSFCMNGPNFTNGIGELFGPYRVSSDLEFDIPFNSKNDTLLQNIGKIS